MPVNRRIGVKKYRQTAKKAIIGRNVNTILKWSAEAERSKLERVLIGAGLSRTTAEKELNTLTTLRVFNMTAKAACDYAGKKKKMDPIIRMNSRIREISDDAQKLQAQRIFFLAKAARLGSSGEGYAKAAEQLGSSISDLRKELMKLVEETRACRGS